MITCGGEGNDPARPTVCGSRPAAHRVEYVGGTGAGDAFDAGYIAGLLAGGDPAEMPGLGQRAGGQLRPLDQRHRKRVRSRRSCSISSASIRWNCVRAAVRDPFRRLRLSNRTCRKLPVRLPFPPIPGTDAFPDDARAPTLRTQGFSLRRPSPTARHYFVPLFWGVFLVVIGIVFVTKGELSEWQDCFIRASRHMLDRETIHRVPPEGYAYPPAMAMLAVPMARMSTSGSLFTWFLVNAVAIMTVAGCSWMLVGGPRVVGMSRPWQVVFWLTVVLEARFFVASLEHQQFDMVIAALLLAGCVALWRGCDWRAGLLLGASAAMKCTPLLFGPWLIWRRKWKAAAAMAVVAVGLNVLPDVLFPQASGDSYLGDWYRLMLAPVSQTAPGTWHTDLLLNQSLAGFAQRIARWLLVEHIGTDPNAVLSAATAQVLRITTYGTALFLLTITAWHFGRPFQAPARALVRSSGPLPWSDLQMRRVLGAVCLMLLLSPMSGKRTSACWCCRACSSPAGWSNARAG